MDSATRLTGTILTFSMLATTSAGQVHVHALHDGIAGPGDEFGVWASSCGHVDGDGCADIAVGVRYYDCTAGDDAGAVFLFSGRTGEILWGRCGLAGENFGSALDFIGDVSGDGKDDLVVGAVAAGESSPGSGDPTGRFYVISGGSGTTLHTESGSQQNDWLGYRVAGGGDLNADSMADYIVSALFALKPAGPVTGYARAYSGLDHAVLFTVYGAAQGDDVGSALDIIEDMNGDGFDDAIIGISQGHATSGVTKGRVLIVSGATPATATDPIVICTLEGDSHLDAFGSSVAALGDVDRDGTRDFVVGATELARFPGASGYARVFSGWDCSLLWEFTGAAADDELGGRVADAGDFNGDGCSDILVAAGGFDGNAGRNTGVVHVYSGLTGMVLFTREGDAAQDGLQTASGGGDLNGDGYDDVVIGATGDDLQGSAAGTAYAYCGYPDGCVNDQTSLDADSDGIPDDCEPWTDLGFALAGVDGVLPKLDGFGFLVEGKPMRLDLKQAKPLSFATLVVGVTELNAPFKGGTMVPNPVLLLGLTASANGEVPLAVPSWPSGLSGADLFFQYWIVDGAGPVGFAASNGLRGEVP